jgi:hypothetical protein
MRAGTDQNWAPPGSLSAISDNSVQQWLIAGFAGWHNRSAQENQRAVAFGFVESHRGVTAKDTIGKKNSRRPGSSFTGEVILGARVS